MESVHAIYEGKTFRLSHPLDLKLGQEVELTIKEITPVEEVEEKSENDDQIAAQ